MDRYLVLDLPGRSSDPVCEQDELDNVESSSQARAKQEFLPRTVLPSSRLAATLSCRHGSGCAPARACSPRMFVIGGYHPRDGHCRQDYVAGAPPANPEPNGRPFPLLVAAHSPAFRLRAILCSAIRAEGEAFWGEPR